MDKVDATIKYLQMIFNDRKINVVDSIKILKGHAEKKNWENLGIRKLFANWVPAEFTIKPFIVTQLNENGRKSLRVAYKSTTLSGSHPQ